MNIIVLNGSPKGDLSITLQYVRYVAKKYPQHEFSTLHIARDIHKIENDQQRFAAVIEQISAADIVLWSFPLYYLLVHAHYKRFIELIWERQATAAFQGKYTLAIASSIHFYDHTALQYIRAVCNDLGMHFLDDFSADMQDLLNTDKRQQLLIFADNALQTVAQQGPTFRVPQPVPSEPTTYRPGPAPSTVDSSDKRVLIVTDAKNSTGNQAQMVSRLQANFGDRAQIVNLQELRIETSCLGCIQCGYDNSCPLEDKDDFISFYRDQVMTADILIYAGSIQDRYLSARWKTFFDRSFFMGHTPTLKGKQIGIIVAGQLSCNPHLHEIFRAYFEMMETNLVGIVSDEGNDSVTLDGQLDLLCQHLMTCSQQNYRKPQTFLSIAGHKLLRDEIWGRLRFPFIADHHYFKTNGGYDFPHRDWRSRLRNGVMMLLMKVPRIRGEVYRKRIKGEMVKALQKVVEEA